MQWSEIIGQDELSKKLRNLVDNNRLPHALLLNGKLGYGGMSIARALATYVQCRNKNGLESCGDCDQCKRNTNLENPDLILSFPAVSQGGPTTAEDFYPEFIEFQKNNPYGTLSQWLGAIDAEKKLANITAKECRRIKERLSLKPVSAEYKVLVMWLPEFLGKEGNLLLKLIEEPTPKTLLILVSEDYNSLLSTIKSRVQEVSVPPISSEKIAETASTLLPLFHAKDPIYNTYGGDWARVLQAAQPAETDMDILLKGYLNAVFKNNIDSQVEWVSSMEQYSKNEILSFLDFAQDKLYSLIRADKNTSDSVIQKLRKYGISLEQVAEWQNLLNEIQYSLTRNVQLKLSLHNLVLRSSYIVREFVLN